MRYLRHIAAKVTGTVPGVRPRVPSLFEPVKGAGAVGSVEGGTREVESLARSAREARVETPVVRDPMAALTRWIERGEEPRPVVAAVAEQGFVAVVKEAGAREVLAERVVPVERKAAPVEVRTESRGAAFREAEARVGLKSPEIERTVETQAVERKDAAIELRETVRVERERVVERVRPAEMESARRPALVTKQESLAHVGTPVKVEVVTGQATARGAVAAAQEARGDETMGVQVTIGRVIVEASFPAAAPTPVPVRSMAGPRLSLDEYLRQRGGNA